MILYKGFDGAGTRISRASCRHRLEVDRANNPERSRVSSALPRGLPGLIALAIPSMGNNTHRETKLFSAVGETPYSGDTPVGSCLFCQSDCAPINDSYPMHQYLARGHLGFACYANK